MSCSNEQLKFTVFMINRIADSKNISTAEVYSAMAESGVIDEYLIPQYEPLHTLGEQYVIEDLVGLMRDRGVEI
ncbi:MAG: DUF3791 domain-containing protein [Anaerovoracaceae bacterium]